MIHPTAIVHAKAEIGNGTTVGAFTVIEAGIKLGENCVVGPHVYLMGESEIGAGTRIHAGCVLGDLPQDLRFKGSATRLIIGQNNVIREHVTIHRSNSPNQPTRIGSNNLFMAHCHVGHNTSVGDHVIIANGALLAGHTEIHDRVFISGNCLVHQFVRVGTLALMQGGSAISKDLPPFTIARGDNGMCGLNVVGLRRAGISSVERLELRRLYRFLFREGRKLRKALEMAREQFRSDRARILIDFVAGGKRGFCADTGMVTDEAE